MLVDSVATNKEQSKHLINQMNRSIKLSIDALIGEKKT
jgi:hypothetical protein